MAGDLALFEESVGPLPRRARVPLADVMSPYQPHRAASLIADSEDRWARLVRIRLGSQDNDDRRIQGARKNLETCRSEVEDPSPEWSAALALTEAQVLEALGDLDGSQRVLKIALEQAEADPGDLMQTRLRLAGARCALSRGSITQARSSARTLLLESRERDLPGLQVAACDLLARVHLIAGEPNAAIPLVQEALLRWHEQSTSTVSVLVTLLRATLSFYTESHIAAGEKLKALGEQSELESLAALRPYHHQAAVLEARITCMYLISAWCLNKEAPEDILQSSHRRLTLSRPRPTWWIGIQTAVHALVTGRPDEAIETIQELIERNPVVDRVAEALAWGLLAKCQDEVKKGSTRSRNQARSILDEIGAAPPPELMLLQARKTPVSAL